MSRSGNPEGKRGGRRSSVRRKPRKLTRVFRKKIRLGKDHVLGVTFYLDHRRRLLAEIQELAPSSREGNMESFPQGTGIRIYESEISKFFQMLQEMIHQLREEILPDYTFSEFSGESEAPSPESENPSSVPESGESS